MVYFGDIEPWVAGVSRDIILPVGDATAGSLVVRATIVGKTEREAYAKLDSAII